MNLTNMLKEAPKKSTYTMIPFPESAKKLPKKVKNESTGL